MAINRCTGWMSSCLSKTRCWTSARTRWVCALSNCGRKRTNGVGRSPSWSTACRSLPKGPTGSPPIPSPRGSATSGWNTSSAARRTPIRTCCAYGAVGSTRRSASTISATGTASWCGRISSSPAPCTRMMRRSSTTYASRPWRTSGGCAIAPAWPCGAATTKWSGGGSNGDGATCQTPGVSGTPTTECSTTSCRRSSPPRTPTRRTGPVRPHRTHPSSIPTASGSETPTTGRYGTATGRSRPTENTTPAL